MSERNDQHRAGGSMADAFPLSKHVLVDAALPVATVVVAITCAALVLTQQQLNAANPDPVLAFLLDDLIFSYIPVGVSFLLLAVAVKKHTGLVGVTSGFILWHLLFAIVIGGALSVVKGHTDWLIFVVVTTLQCMFTIIAWALFCTYPEFLYTGIRREMVLVSQYQWSFMPSQS